MATIEQSYIDLTEQFNNAITDINKEESSSWRAADDYCNGFITLNKVKSKHNPVERVAKYKDLDKKGRCKLIHLENKIKEDRPFNFNTHERRLLVNGETMKISEVSRLISVNPTSLAKKTRAYKSFIANGVKVDVIHREKTMYSIQHNNEDPILEIKLDEAARIMGVSREWAFASANKNKTTKKGWRIWKHKS